MDEQKQEQEECAVPLLKIRLPLLHRSNCFIRLWFFKIMVSLFFTIDRRFNPLPASVRPTLIKYYPCRPYLQVRLFFPPCYKPGELLSLYLNVHGGAFAVCDPQNDDEFCVMWAKRTRMLIASLGYSKAPLHPFPKAVFDVAALTNAILTDSSLPIDKSKIAIGGFSAGGNLALCASQLPGLKGEIKAALTFYPIVDWSHPPDKKLEMRPYTAGSKDSLEYSSYWFDWGYVSPGQNRRDPLLSPSYARKEDLPPWIYIIGAQWDMLRLESQEMIHELAGLKDKEDHEEDFESGTFKWTLARGCSHGFTHHVGHKGRKREYKEQKCKPIYDQAHEWLTKALREHHCETST